jgi:hypothetical protein
MYVRHCDFWTRDRKPLKGLKAKDILEFNCYQTFPHSVSKMLMAILLARQQTICNIKVMLI